MTILPNANSPTIASSGRHLPPDSIFEKYLLEGAGAVPASERQAVWDIHQFCSIGCGVASAGLLPLCTGGKRGKGLFNILVI